MREEYQVVMAAFVVILVVIGRVIQQHGRNAGLKLGAFSLFATGSIIAFPPMLMIYLCSGLFIVPIKRVFERDGRKAGIKFWLFAIITVIIGLLVASVMYIWMMETINQFYGR
jgi:hypothetical protein